GLVLNSLLLYLIRRFSRVELGTYKYLLSIFAAYDIFLSVLDSVTNTVCTHVKVVCATGAHSEYYTRHMCIFRVFLCSVYTAEYPFSLPLLDDQISITGHPLLTTEVHRAVCFVSYDAVYHM
ncbi:hypothetical protein PENTCL1PPCAC_14742, partial [Pristionchus entomophagus]